MRRALRLPHLGKRVWMSGHPLRVAGLALLGIGGLAGLAAAIEHYITNHIPKMPGETRLMLKLESPYCSVDLRPGSDPTDVATVELPTGDGTSSGFQFSHKVANGNIGVLRMGVCEEGMLETPPLAMWKANTQFSPVSTRLPQSDMGMRLTPGTLISYTLPPIYSYSQSYARGFIRFRPMPVLAVGEDGMFEAKSNGSTVSTKIRLSKELPMDFSAALGFGESSLNLSGLPITNATIETGASRAHIFTTEPNPQVLGNCLVRAGLGEVIFSGISNLNAKHFNFHGGVGSYHLGFDGKLLQNLDAQVELGIGLCSIAIPPTAGRVQIFYDEGLLNSYTFSGLTTRHKGYVTSVGFDQATGPILTLRLSAGAGRMSITYH